MIVIRVTSEGFEPGSIELQRGIPAHLVFTRTTTSGCAEEVQIPAIGVEPVYLPLNEPVELEFYPAESGVFQFVCGMDMMRGRMVISP